MVDVYEQNFLLFAHTSYTQIRVVTVLETPLLAATLYAHNLNGSYNVIVPNFSIYRTIDL